MKVQQTGSTLIMEGGEPVTGAYLDVGNFSVLEESGQVYMTLKAWRNLDSFNANDNPVGLKVNGNVVKSIIYIIPQADIDAMNAAMEYDEIGQNHKSYALQALEDVTGVAKENFNVASLW